MPASEPQLRSQRLPRQLRRAQLLNAAREVFVSEGYHAAGMDDIAERAGVSKPVLYQHFPSKLDLYLALLDAGAAQLVDAVRTRLVVTADNRERVHGAIEAYFSFVDDAGEAYRLVFESDLSNEPAVLERARRTDEQCASLISRVIEDDTGLGEQDSRTLAFGLIGMAQMAARRWLNEGRVIPRDQAIELVFRMIWRGISGFPLTSDQRGS